MRALVLLVVFVVGCGKGAAVKDNTPSRLLEARSKFKTNLIPQASDRDPIEVPPKNVFELIKYKAPAGMLGAYVTPDPKDDKKHPAIIWITGGDCNSIGDVWSPAEPENDQTAAIYRQKGIVMMFPSLRGGNQNPGKKETFLGEVDDILAAADHLSKLPYVDSERIYLGGHSTGGTMVLLVAECSNRFRAIFSFGPVDRVGGYPQELLGFDRNNEKEEFVRSPEFWLDEIKTPTFVFEGKLDGNLDALYTFKEKTDNPLLKLYGMHGHNHFNVLAPTNALIAEQILKDTGSEANITFKFKEL